jgi:hypothetical protein
MEFAPFYIGQRVVAIINHSKGMFKKGDEFIIMGIERGNCMCNKWLVRLNTNFGYSNGPVCRKCNIKTDPPYTWINADRFAPIEEKFESISLYEIIETETALISKN